MLRLWTVMAVVAAAGGGARAILSRMNDLSQGLQLDVVDAKRTAVNYSSFVVNVSYTASVEFDMRAMGPLYNSTHTVIDVIAHKQAYPDGIVRVVDGHLEVAPLREQWRPLVAHYAGPVAVLATAVLLAALLPLAGLFWCCCYWCRVGRRRRPFDRKYDACLKGLLAIILIALLTLFLFGVVCLFATEAQVEAGAREAPGTMRASIKDAQTFLRTTHRHARHLLVTNYNELARTLRDQLNSSGEAVSKKLEQFSKAVSVTTLHNIVRQLEGVRTDLQRVSTDTRDLRAKAEELNAGLRKIKRQLLDTLRECKKPKCRALQEKYDIGQLSTEIHYSQMPDVSELLNNVSQLLDSNIQAEVAAGSEVYATIQRGIRDSMGHHIPSVLQAIHDTGSQLETLADQITARAEQGVDTLQQQAQHADRLQRLHAAYGPYRWYLGLAAALAPLTITCLFALGVTCGVCGKRPDVYGASECCNKGAGSKCLLCGIGLIFILGGAMAAVMAAYFLIGVSAQRFVCDPLTEPRDNRLMMHVEQLIDLQHEVYGTRTSPHFNLTTVLLDCHRNLTIYKTLQLSRRIDMSGLRENISASISQQMSSLQATFPRGTAVILPPGARLKLRQLEATGLSDFDFDRILHALESNLTSLALETLARQLTATVSSLGGAGSSEEARSLQDAALALQRLVRDVLDPMRAITDNLNSTASRLRDELRFNHSSLNEAIVKLVAECDQAERFLNNQGPDRLQNISREYGAVISDKFNAYLELVARAAESEVGRCGPLSNAFNATRDAACNKILMPVNGYWMSLAWCVLLFVPLMVVGQRLARLYLHADPYPGPLVEAEYLYDAYADRDNVPLANAYKAEKRGGRARAREGEATSGGGGGGGSGPAARADLAPPVDAHHARRYNDMAPKHWEEGPPRYHGPTEYERPPPYYYPGPNGLPRARGGGADQRRRRALYASYQE